MTFLAGPDCDCGEDHWAIIEPLLKVSPFGCFEWQGAQGGGYGRLSHRRRAGLEPDDSRHGTRIGYEEHGCRCRPCLVANSVASREKYELFGPRPVTKTLAADDERHGTANGYLNYRCRCEPCVDAGREYARFRHAERRAGRRHVPAYLEAER